MKICAACSQSLPKENFSKKQWQLKQTRRCKECIGANREVQSSLEASNDLQLPSCAVDGGGALCWTDEDLFKEPPPRDECPICMLPLPLLGEETICQSCCGKRICHGCTHAVDQADNRGLCPFCRTPLPTSDEEILERTKKRVEGGDASAMFKLGCKYFYGMNGLRRNTAKAMKLWLRAGELGDNRAHNMIGYSHDNGTGVDRDEKKAKHYYELAAMGGDVLARHNLGLLEWRAGNIDRAMKHWMITAGAGLDESLKRIRKCFLNGHATKDDFEKALRTHKEAKDEMRSDQRDAAAAARRRN